MVGLRKGTPYLLEAFRMIRKHHPSERLMLTRSIHDSVKSILAQYSDLSIDWAPSLPHQKLAERLQAADIFVMPSLEDGFALVVSEALACGLPVITTPNTGAMDYIIPDVNGEIVPLRDSKNLAATILKWGDRIMKTDSPPKTLIRPEELSILAFERRFLEGTARLEATHRL